MNRPLQLTHLPKTKWTPFFRPYFQMHFCEWKILYFDKNFTEVFIDPTQGWFSVNNMKFSTRFKRKSKKCFWKCGLQTLHHTVQGPMSKYLFLYTSILGITFFKFIKFYVKFLDSLVNFLYQSTIWITSEIDRLVQERRTPLLTHWGYVFHALTHRGKTRLWSTKDVTHQATCHNRVWFLLKFSKFTL